MTISADIGGGRLPGTRLDRHGLGCSNLREATGGRAKKGREVPPMTKKKCEKEQIHD